MKEEIRAVLQENNPPKIGLIVSTIIIVGSLIPSIKSNLFTISSENSTIFFLAGLAMLFFFMGIKVNMTIRYEKVGESIQASDILPPRYTLLSKTCFFISFIIGIIFILKLII